MAYEKKDKTMGLSIGAQIKAWRKMRKMSQEELAYAVGISNIFLCYIEKERRNYSSDLLKKILNELRVDITLTPTIKN